MKYSLYKINSLVILSKKVELLDCVNDFLDLHLGSISAQRQMYSLGDLDLFIRSMFSQHGATFERYLTSPFSILGL